MARHILAGERPVFFYGQAYMGSLDAYLVAGAFLIAGEQVYSIRIVQILLYVGTIITTVILGRRLFPGKENGIIPALLLAFPVVNVTLYTTVSLGGYGEALFIGNLILLTALSVCHSIKEEGTKEKRSLLLFSLLFGFLTGIGFWANGLTLIYSIPATLYVIYKVRVFKKIETVGIIFPFFLLGAIAGSFPVWVFIWQQGWQSLVAELMGSSTLR